MTRINWQRAADRDRVRRGSEPLSGGDLAPAGPFRPRPSKRELIEEADKLLAESSGTVATTISCPKCGRVATVQVKASRLRSARFRCKVCDPVAR